MSNIRSSIRISEGPRTGLDVSTQTSAPLSPAYGIRGPQGERGPVAAFSIGDTTTLTPGSPATATITGTDEAPVLNLGIPQGTKGDTGSPGTDGVSPTVSVTNITGGHRISITDANGTKTYDVMDGANGTNGVNGISPTVAITSISGGHRISITDHQMTRTADIMDGIDGTNGTNGTNGVSPSVSVTSITGGHRISITDYQSTSMVDVMDGVDGTDGTDGSDGVSPSVSVTAITGGNRVSITDSEDTHTFDVMDGDKGDPGPMPEFSCGTVTTLDPGEDASVTITGTAAEPVINFSIPKGANGTNGTDGTNGHTPVKGTDYWTTADKGEIINAAVAATLAAYPAAESELF